MRLLAAGVSFLSLMACLVLAAPSVAAVSCSRTAPDHLLSVTATNAFTKLIRAQNSIQVDDGHSVIDCDGGQANVNNTDLVQVSHTGNSADTVDLSGGPFAPGFTQEPVGSSEIEFQYLTRTFLDVRGTAGPDSLTLLAGGVNVNGDDDPDITGLFSTIVIEGRGGNDFLGPRTGGKAPAARRILFGQSGRDKLVATANGSILHGGDGNDKLLGGRSHDNLTGGRGVDVMRGGKGKDLLRAIDGTSDRVNCGPGIDRAKVDGIDRVRGCERLIAVKRR